MKKFILGLLLLLNCTNAFSQTVMIRGKIINAENSPLEGVNVALQTMDSTFVSGGVTDAKGNFAIKNITPGNYYLNMSFVGYKPERLLIKNLSKDQSLGNIR
jgi:protocatechuate 3,4-dioxygenase beta subunit